MACGVTLRLHDVMTVGEMQRLADAVCDVQGVWPDEEYPIWDADSMSLEEFPEDKLDELRSAVAGMGVSCDVEIRYGNGTDQDVWVVSPVSRLIVECGRVLELLNRLRSANGLTVSQTAAAYGLEDAVKTFMDAVGERNEEE